MVIDINRIGTYTHFMDTSTHHSNATGFTNRPISRMATVSAAVLYSVVWIVGLFIPVTAIAKDSSQKETWDANEGNVTAFVQTLLIHGLAAIFLAIVAISLARSARSRSVSRSHWISIAGLTAATISLVQFVLETAMVAGRLGVSETNAHDFWLAVAVLDGIKMFALAAFVGAVALVGAMASNDTPFVSKWLRNVGFATVAALVLSGVGYTILNEPLMLTAALSLPLLLISVTLMGILASRPDGLHVE